MSGYIDGVRGLLSRDFPQCKFFHCFAHGISLVTVKSLKDDRILNMFSVIKSTYSFLSFPKRFEILKKYISETGVKKIKPIKMNEMKWAYRFKALEYFKINFDSIKKCLNEISESKEFEKSYRKEATYNLAEILNFNFVLMLVFIEKCLH